MKNLLSLLAIFLYSLTAFTQTTGPTQPEAAGFQPIGSDNLVDLYTGDFNYSLLVLVVPDGTGSGYPINLFYNSNVSMGQVASWGGLGFNVNNGAIQRNLRGLPDDFKGDEIKKKFWTKPSTTVSIDASTFKKEVLGGNVSLGTQYSIYYNNYSGLGMSSGLSLGSKVDEHGMTSNGLHGSLGLGFDSQEGISLSPRLSYNWRNETLENAIFDGKGYSLSLGTRLNSKQGFSDLDMNFSKTTYQRVCYVCRIDDKIDLKDSNKRNGGISFASSAPLSPISFARTTTAANFSIEIDPAKIGLTPTIEKLNLGGSITVSALSKKEKKTPAYGAMYLSNKTDDSIIDFYRENEGAITKDKVITPIPILTYDVFSIQGHGVGGSFRAYQNSVGKLSDPVVKSYGGSGSVGLEYAAGTAMKLGADLSASFTRSYSGVWKKKDRFQQHLEKYQFDNQKASKPLFESFYFKMIGETQPLPISQWEDLEEDDPLAFDLQLGWDVISAKAKVLHTSNHANRELSVKRYPDRNPRVQSIEYFTNQEISINRPQTKHIYAIDSNNNNTPYLKPIDYTGENHHLAALSVLKPNGVRYNYSLPAYNKTTVKETFAIPGTTEGNPKVIEKVGGIDVMGYATVNNDAGEDEFYSREEIPQYAHTYFLTSITSQDYVDIDNNGLSIGDIGEKTNLIYEQVTDYEWRFPYKGAYYIKGYNSNLEDDKASWQGGIKDLFYVKAIETKTHIAVFTTVDSELQGVNGKRQKQLKKITLYSKSDPDYSDNFYVTGNSTPTPIQEVHFHQNYHLRQGTPNSNAPQGYSPALDSLHITYYDSKKGENAKYYFNYGENPAYQTHQQDRWGAYQSDRDNILVNENPYTYQDASYSKRDEEAAAWLLDEITLPSKGQIKVDYEKDDYAFVQDRPAMSFVELIGSGDSLGNHDEEFSKDDEYLYFKSPFPLATSDDVRAQLKGIDYVRFRVYLDLKFSDRLGGRASDYVEGYTKVLGDARRLDENIGYFKIERIKPKSNSTFKAHPIRLAAWQYLRKSRPDLGIDFGDLKNIDPVVFATRNTVSMINELGNLIGYYTTAAIKGWAKQMDTSKPSYVRLVNPQRKYGGGARVKQITMYTNDPQNPTYGQTYHYELENGQSSGVAEFEPLLGLEACAFTQPVWYNPNNDGNRILFSNEQSFHEEPLGAGIYPSAQVGYSRVWVKNLEHDQIRFAQSGISVSEFYTAKDFPTKFASYGAILKEYPVQALIPLVGMQSFNNSGYSMGYSYTLNNSIYGRPKSEATYPYNFGSPSGQPIQEARYNYQVKANNPKMLDNQVVALRKEGQKESVLLGKEVDFYIDEIEAATWSLGGGSQVNLNVQSPVVWLPSWFPSLNYTESNTRYITTNKIIYNNPILASIEKFKDGAKIETKNLYYDYETGDPIITSVNNEWEQPIYTYNFPAHWTYEQMKGAATNYRALLAFSWIRNSNDFQLTAGLVNGTIPSQLLQEGDVILSAGQEFYVTELDRNNNRFKLSDRQGNPAATNLTAGTIIQSGFKNLQSTRKGKIVSLQDYSGFDPTTAIQTTDGIDYLITRYNAKQPYFNNVRNQNAGSLGYIDLPACMIDSVDIGYAKRNNRLSLSFYYTSVNRECVVDIPVVIDSIFLNQFETEYLLFLPNTRSGNQIQMRYNDPSNTTYHGTTYTANLSGLLGCFECEERIPITVLHADATEYKDEWNLNYQELEDESTDLSGINMTDIANGLGGNPYAYGLKGVWRPWRTSAYLTDRKQSGTNGLQTRIDLDGEYDNFYWFDWKKPINYNEDYNWRWVNEVTQYNVNGQSKEGRNRLDIHAASLFGYKNHLVTAAANNAKTSEIAFDGFEDYVTTGQINHGNLAFNLNTNAIQSGLAHTGKKYLSINSPTVFTTNSTDYFQPVAGKKYVISVWTDAQDILKSSGYIEVKEGNTTLLTLRPDFSKNINVDGWTRLEGVFIPNSNNIQIILNPPDPSFFGRGKGVFDDLRIQPFNSGMETYVYDPDNYRLLAKLSNQNYATFYNYDEEGNLIQTKVETERGVKTITQNRQNIRR